MSRPQIVLTNDDGIQSPGLRAAVEAVLPLGEVTVLAPERQQSSMGRSLWGDRNEKLCAVEYAVNGTAVPAYSCHASPALTVLHGLAVLGAARHPDLLVTGINYGENLGMNVTLSGTIGAALEAAALGVPSLAVSLQTDIADHFQYGDMDWRAAQHFCRLFASRMLARRMPFDVDVIKVDVPKGANSATPWKLTRLSRQSYFSARLESPGLHNRIGDAQLGIWIDQSSLERDSDIAAVVNEGVVSVTPLSLDLTSRADLAALEASLRQEP